MRLNLIISILLLIFEPAFSQKFLKKTLQQVDKGSKVLRDIKGGDAEADNDISDENAEDPSPAYS